MNEVIELLLNLNVEVKRIAACIRQFQKTPLEQFNETWLDAQEVMQALHISTRTLQTLRDKEILPFSRINGKFYYKLSDIEQLLESNYSPFKSNNHGL